MRRLHPATLAVAILPSLKESLRAASPLLLGSLASGHGVHMDWVAGILGAFTGLFTMGAYFTTRFDIEPGHVVHKSGWIFRKDRRIPLVQIQNVNIRQNVLERFLKVATVDVETAMGRGRDLKLSVLSLPEAERFRSELLGAAHLDAPTRVANEPLVRLSTHDLFLGAITESHFFQMFSVMITLGWAGIGPVIRFASHLPPALEAAAVAGAVAVMAIGGWLWGIASYFLKYGGFVVESHEGVYRISYGLLNRAQLAIRPGRIELVRLTTSILQRLIGRTSVRVGTASSFGEAGVLAPIGLFVNKYTAYSSAQDVLPGLDIPALRWQPFHPLFYRAAVFRGAIAAGILALIAWSLSASGGATAIFVWTGFSIWVGLIAFRLAGLFLSRPENAFAITEDALVVRRGYVDQTLTAMPINRMEFVAIRQPAWWINRRAVIVTAQAMKQKLSPIVMPQPAADDLLAHWHAKMSMPVSTVLATASLDCGDLAPLSISEPASAPDVVSESL